MRFLAKPFYVILLILLVGAMQSTAAQSTRVSGRVVDDDGGRGIATATVSLWTASDSSLVTGTVTDADGDFAIDGASFGDYFLEISFVGFITRRIDVMLTAGDPVFDAGEIRLRMDAQVLDEVQVEAEREFMEVGVDRIVYNTAEQLVSIGGSASTVLENIPSVETDIDGNISLRGNQNVAVLINGKSSPMTGEALTTFLEGLPADIVERVEVIPNPSARYEPDGMAGILNIVLQEDRDPGFTGGISLTGGTQHNYNASVNVNYQAGRLGLFGSYGFRSGGRSREGWRHRENRYEEPLTFLDQDNFSDGGRLSHTLNTRLDYDLSELNTISLSSILSHRTGDSDGRTVYRYSDRFQDLTDHYERRSEGERKDLNMDLRLRFDRIIDRGSHELTAEISFDNEREDDFERYVQEVFESAGPPDDFVDERETNREDEHEREWSFELDYLRPFGEEGKIEAGYHFDFERLDSESHAELFDDGLDRWLDDPDRTNSFRYDEQIHAAYGIIGTTIGKFGLQGGVRAERALTYFDLANTPDRHRNSYFSLFPNAYINYVMTDARSLRLSYSKRARRPRTWQMNPFDNNRDPLFRRIGNPALTPQYVHALEVSLTQFTERTSLTVSPYYRRTVDVIRRLETVDEDGVTISTFENLDTRDSWGIETVGRIDIGDWMSAYTSVNVYRVVTDGSNVDADLGNDAYGFSTRTNATVNVRPGLDLQISHYYRAPQETERGRVSSRQSADIAVRQQILGNRASLSLRARDVFDQRNFHVTRDDALYFLESHSNWDARRVSLTFRYNFGDAGRDGNARRGGGPQRGPGENGDEEFSD